MVLLDYDMVRAKCNIVLCTRYLKLLTRNRILEKKEIKFKIPLVTLQFLSRLTLMFDKSRGKDQHVDITMKRCKSIHVQKIQKIHTTPSIRKTLTKVSIAFQTMVKQRRRRGRGRSRHPRRGRARRVAREGSRRPRRGRHRRRRPARAEVRRRGWSRRGRRRGRWSTSA